MCQGTSAVLTTRDSVLPRLTTILVAPVTTRIREIPTELSKPSTVAVRQPPRPSTFIEHPANPDVHALGERLHVAKQQVAVVIHGHGDRRVAEVALHIGRAGPLG